jgi:hypothetical protein
VKLANIRLLGVKILEKILLAFQLVLSDKTFNKIPWLIHVKAKNLFEILE